MIHSEIQKEVDAGGEEGRMVVGGVVCVADSRDCSGADAELQLRHRGEEGR